MEAIKRIAEIELQCRRRLTENDGNKNDGPSKLHNMKLQGVKLTDQVAGYGIAGHEFAGHKNARHETGGHENAGHEIAGQKKRKCIFLLLFLNTQQYDGLCINDCLLKSGSAM